MRWLVLGLAFGCLPLVAACSERTPDTSPTPVDACGYNLSLTTGTFSASGGAGVGTVTTAARCAWSASADANWVVLEGASDRQGPGDFKFTVAAASDTVDRQTTLRVATAKATVSQSPCAITVDSQPRAIGDSGGQMVIAVDATGPCAWQAEGDSDWLKLDPLSGHGRGQVTLVVGENNTAAPRTAHVRIGGTLITLSQSSERIVCRPTIRLRPDQFSLGGGTGVATIDAASTCEWTLRSDAAWVLFEGAPQGTGRAERVFTVQPTASSEARRARLSVGDDTAVLSQSGTGCEYRVSPVNTEVDYPAGAGAFDVSTAPGCEFTVETAAPWLHTLQGGTVQGPARITYEYDAFVPAYSTETRKAPIEVRWEAASAGQNVWVEQYPTCRVGIANPPEFAVGGGAYTIILLADSPFSCPWRVLEDLPWLVAAPTRWHGDGEVTLTVAPNATGAPRSGTITIAGVPITISQRGQ